MKIILSRKGFDSGSGGYPSPVLPDGTMLSLPIPEGAGRLGGAVPYDEIAVAGWDSAGAVAAQLGIPWSTLRRGAHLDPDLVAEARPRLDGWRPAFGQAGASSSHLDNQGVGPGDLFVFWGLFRHTVANADGTVSFAKGAQPFHAVFGWLAVGEVLRPDADATPAWVADHPHVVLAGRTRNRLYIAGDDTSERAGAGTLRWDPRRQLSVPGPRRSLWTLPASCHPDRSGTNLTYHTDPARWTAGDGNTLTLQTVGRGQEFVADATDAWVAWADHVLAPT